MSLTILIIDDNEDDRRLYRHALRNFDCTLEMASTAETGFEIVSGTAPELILLDYSLPDSDGLRFIERLSESSAMPVSIIMLTGEGSTEVAVEAIKRGAADYLVKDTAGNYLRLLPSVITKVLSAAAQRQQAERLRLETESLLRRNQILMQTSMDGIHVLDASGNLVEANDAFCSMLGYSRQELLGKNAVIWNAECSAEQLSEWCAGLNGKSARFETVQRRKDGQLIHVEISSTGVEMDGQRFIFSSSHDISERIHAGQALQMSEANLRAMLDNSPYLTWLKDAQGRYITINKAFAEYLQLENVDQAIGKTDLELQPKALAEKYRADDIEVMASRVQKHVEESAFDGKSTHWVETYKTPIIDDNGSVLGTVGFARDITRRKLWEVETATLLRRNQTLMKSSMDGIHIMDIDGNLVEANDSFLRMLGYTPEEAKGLNVADWNAQWSRAELRTKFNEMIGKSRVFETRHRRKDGSLIDVEISSAGVEIEGKPLLFASSRDITERKRAEAALQQHKLVIDTSIDGFWVTDVQGHLLEANEAYAKMSGYSVKELLGMHISQLEAIEVSASDVEQHVAKIIAQGYDRFETRHRRKDGGEIDIEVSVTYMADPQRLFVFCRNITESKKTAAQLLSLNHQLTHEVAKRTADLSALAAHIQNIAETERANIARELHDELGNTLVGINMEFALLKGKINDPGLLQDLSFISELLANANSITRGVITKLYPTILDHDGFVAAVQWLVSGFKQFSNVAVQMALPEQIEMENPFALAAYRITQECLTNIAKHASASQVRIEAKAADDFLELSISDDGQGISAPQKSTGHGIFGMIERARHLGGSLELESIPGKGTTVRLRLPTATIKPKYRKKVLVVDDHTIVRDALRLMLQRSTDDFSVEGEAADGMSAVELALQQEWDIMLLDIALPKKSGIQALREILAVKPRLPIIMLSSHASEDYAEQARSIGAACYIEKADTGKLVEAMRRATVACGNAS